MDLPFFDDFSGKDIFPDAARWSDDIVFINNTYTVDQMTTGVATFDALDNKGRLYETASSHSFQSRLPDFTTIKTESSCIRQHKIKLLLSDRADWLMFLRRMTALSCSSMLPTKKNGIRHGELPEAITQNSSLLYYELTIRNS